MSEGCRRARTGRSAGRTTLPALLALFFGATALIANRAAFADTDDAPAVPTPPGIDTEPATDIDEDDPCNPDPDDAELALRRSRSTHRLSVDVSAGFLASSSKGGGEVGGGALTLGTPIWMGNCWRFGQFDAVALSQLGISTTGRVHASAALAMRFHLHQGRRLSMEMQIGPALGSDLGPGGPGAVGIGLTGGGGYVLHPLDDHRTRVKFGFTMWLLAGLRATAGNDCPLCSGHVGLALGFETAL